MTSCRHAASTDKKHKTLVCPHLPVLDQKDMDMLIGCVFVSQCHQPYGIYNKSPATSVVCCPCRSGVLCACVLVRALVRVRTCVRECV
jgi:hypothetical protein